MYDITPRGMRYWSSRGTRGAPSLGLAPSVLRLHSNPLERLTKFGQAVQSQTFCLRFSRNFGPQMRVGFWYPQSQNWQYSTSTDVTPSNRPLSVNRPVLGFSTNQYRGCRYLITSRARSTMASALASSRGLHVIAALYSVHGGDTAIVWKYPGLNAFS